MLFSHGRSLNDSEREKATYLYQKYKPILISVSMKILRDVHAVEDVIQATFAMMIRHLDAIEDCDSKRTANYLIVTTKHFAFKELERRKTIQNLFVDFGDDLEQISITENGDDVWNQIKLQISKEELREALSQLNETYRLILIGRYYYDLSYKELSIIVQTSENSVSTMLVRAKRQLARILSQRSGVKE